MDILSLYESLPATTIAEAARRMELTKGQRVQSSDVRRWCISTKDKSVRREAWLVVLDVVESFDEKIDGVKLLIQELLDTILAATTDERID